MSTVSQNQPDPKRIRIWQAAVVAALAVVLCYSNHFENEFHFDDSHAVVQNVYIRSLKNIPKFFTDPTTFSVLPANRTWRPLVSASLAIDYWIGGGLKPLWFHISTFFWYLSQLAVMFFLYRRLLRFASNEWWVNYCALFAAAWYGLHPAMAETVNYVIQRGDLYSTLGVVASMAIYVLYPRQRKFALYLIPFALGILSKPPAAIFPALLFAYIFLFEEDANPRRISSTLARCGPALLVTAVLITLQAKMTPSSFMPGIVSARDYIETQPFVGLHYFICFFVPVTLTADSDLEAFPSLFTTDALVGLFFLGALLWGIWFTARKLSTRPVSFGLIWFLLTLLPTSLFPLSEVENDHRMFMPFVGLALAVSWTVALIVRSRVHRPLAVAAGAVLLLAAYGQGAWQRNRVWRTEETLWKDVTVKSPRNGRGLMNYGLTLMARGDTAGALSYFENAARYTPNYPTLEINHAIASGALGRDADAESHFTRALTLAPGDAQPKYYFGRWLHQKHRNPEAVTLLRLAVVQNPDFVDARDELMRTYEELGKTVDLRMLATETLRRVPGDPAAAQFLAEPVANAQAARPAVVLTRQSADAYLNLSLTYNRAGNYRGSIEAAREALKIRPDYAEAWNNISAGYESLGNWDEAIRAAEMAIKLKPDFQLAKNNLAYSRTQQALAAKGVK